MAQISPNHVNNNNLLQNDVAKETTNTATTYPLISQNKKTLISPPPFPHCDYSPHAPLPNLPFELIIEILSRVPVKSLMQFKCVSKSWKTLITDPQFKRKHLLARNTTHLAMSFKYPTSNGASLTRSYSLQSIFKSSSIVESQADFRLVDGHRFAAFVGSCDGMLCFTISINIKQSRVLLWNLSIQECFMLTPLVNEIGESLYTMYGFGYDNFSHCYKVVAVYCYRSFHRRRVGIAIVYKTLVRVHSYGTSSWRRIGEFPSGVPFNSPGKFVSGALHWLAPGSVALSSRVIVSLDLGTESYQEVLQPDYGDLSVLTLDLGVLRGCLSLLAHCGMFSDIWLMKDYGNKESWTKLVCVPSYMGTPNSFPYSNVLFISEDEEVLLEYHSILVVYNSRTGTFKIPEIEDIGVRGVRPEVYVESLISPC